MLLALSRQPGATSPFLILFPLVKEFDSFPWHRFCHKSQSGPGLQWFFRPVFTAAPAGKLLLQVKKSVNPHNLHAIVTAFEA
jgi:hypothetical protein